MAEDNHTQITKKAADKKFILIGCALVVLFTIAIFLVIFWLGTEAANPWGEEPGPGP